MDQRVKIFVAEVVGTMFLVLGGCGTAVFAAKFGAADHIAVGILGVATAFGMSLLIMAYAIGHVSGCHINPAVTLGMVIGKKLDVALLPVYWIAQLVGGALGGFLLWITFKISDKPVGKFATNGYGDYSPDKWKLGSVAIVEIVMTALLIFVVLSTTHKRFPAGFGGIAAGFTLFVIHLISIPVSNTSVNPARSFGVALFADSKVADALPQLWAFIVFPLIGGVVGAVLWIVVQGSDDEAEVEVGAAA